MGEPHTPGAGELAGHPGVSPEARAGAGAVNPLRDKSEIFSFPVFSEMDADRSTNGHTDRRTDDTHTDTDANRQADG